MYSIRYNTSAHILHLKLEGFWTVATLAGFMAELIVRTAALKVRGDDYGVLSDSTAFPIQSPLITQGFERLVERGAERHRGPTAIVVSGYLNKLQAERTVRGPRVKVFVDEAEAREWLAAEMATRPA